MLQKLLDDHVHILKTLNLLEEQFSCVQTRQNPDYALMLSIIVYLQEYTEKMHHPVEDAIFSILLDRDEHSVKLARELLIDHTRLENMTQRLREYLEQLKSNDHENSGEFEEQLPLLLSRLRRHIQIEEEYVFPLVDSTLTLQDWKNIKQMIPKQMIPVTDDPVFGKKVSNDYRLLYLAINNKR